MGLAESIDNAQLEIITIDAKAAVNAMIKNAFVASLIKHYSRAFHKLLTQRVFDAIYPTDLKPLPQPDAIFALLPPSTRLFIGTRVIEYLRAEDVAFSAFTSSKGRDLKLGKIFGQSLKFSMGVEDIDELEEEVRFGTCVVYPTSSLEKHICFARMAPIIVVKIRCDNNLLVQIGSFDSGKLTSCCKLPGGKLKPGEVADDGLQRILNDKLAPFAEFIDWREAAVNLIEQQSKSYGIPSRYIQTMFIGRLSTGKMWRFCPRYKADYTPPRRISVVSRNSDRNSSIDPPKGMSIMPVQGSADKVALYSWLSQEEYDSLNNKRGEETLQQVIDQFKLLDASGELLREPDHLDSPSDSEDSEDCSDSEDLGKVHFEDDKREGTSLGPAMRACFADVSDFDKGDKVVVRKSSITKGKHAVVLDPDWNGLIKVRMYEDDEKFHIKSVQNHELVHNKACYQAGDRVRVTKDSRTQGKIAVVIEPDWCGLVKVRMEKANNKGQIKSFTNEELEDWPVDDKSLFSEYSF